jgi:saccharopine dehydrogenase (NAD+, L-lysine-forming)
VWARLFILNYRCSKETTTFAPVKNHPPQMLQIGILREEKIPHDTRVALSPEQCKELIQSGRANITIQPSDERCFSNEAYSEAGATISEDLSACDFQLGVKEIPVSYLKENTTYFIFSHTIKEQAHNRPLLQAMLQKKNRLVDYEVLVNEKNERLIAFGRFAGKVGAHNALYTYGKRTGKFSLPRMKDLSDYAAALEIYKHTTFPKMKIVLTGTGRVAGGSVKVLDDMGIRRVSPEVFLNEEFDTAVYTQLSSKHYVKRKDGKPFETAEFYASPAEFESAFAPYAAVSDVFINGIYWDNDAPAFFTVAEMCEKTFRIEVIADVTCDIAPQSSVPSTIRASTILAPVYGFDPFLKKESAPYQLNNIDVMAIDNLPNELPRDASVAFGQQFINSVLPEIEKGWDSPVISRATICVNGHLTPFFEYLQDYVNQLA